MPNCDVDYAAGTIVELTAVPNSGYVFDHWGADIGGFSNPTAITMDAPRSAVYYFKFWCAAREQDFADVLPTDWSFCYIEDIFHAGITTGCYPSTSPAERRYCPEDNVTRAEMAAFLMRARGLTACSDCTQSFNDVPESHWAYGWIEALYREGIATGCVPASTAAERLYCPDQYVTRAEMAAFLSRTFLSTAGASGASSMGQVQSTQP